MAIGARKAAIAVVRHRGEWCTIGGMGSRDKALDAVLRGTSDANVGFRDLCALLKRLGFAERIRGSHHIFTRAGVDEILNLQPKGGKAKPYQVQQVRGVILKYRLAGDDE